MTCHEFFKETNDCYWEDKSVDHTRRISARFLGKEVKPDEAMKERFKKFFVALQSPTLKNHDVSAVLKTFQTDLILSPSQNSHTQLITIEIEGRRLSKILEENFNAGETNQWQSADFRIEDGGLRLEVSGRPLERDRTYRILSDLETIQNDPYLKAYIGLPSTKTHATLSWNELDLTDEVNSTMASTQRQ